MSNKTLISAHMYDTTGFSLRDKILAKLIQWYTKSKYFHTELVWKEHWYTADAFTGKVIKRKLYPLKDKYDYTYTSIEASQEVILDKFFEDIVGTKYDLKSIIFRQIFRFTYNNPNELYCTEVGLKAHHTINKLTHIKDDGTITPGQYKKETEGLQM